MIIFTKQFQNSRNRRSKRSPLKRTFLLVTALASSCVLFLSYEGPFRREQAQTSLEAIIVNTDKVVTSEHSQKLHGSTVDTENQARKLQTPLYWQSVVIQPGDNLSLIFQRLRFSNILLNEIIALDRKTQILPRLRPGQLIKFGLRKKEILSIAIEIDDLSSIWLEKIDGRLISRLESVEPIVKLATASAIITNSLFTDGQEAGLSDSTIMQLTEIFAWDIDFALDLRRGDSFTIIYEQIFKGTEFLRPGKILAAEFVNKGNVSRAAVYPLANNVATYYTPEGEAMKKAFLRAPLEFSRISSRFSLKRKHPILNKIRAHTGVDYAAPLGTPVRATSDGKVNDLGWNGGYGKTIVLNHGHRYSTLYAHLARYNRKLKPGSYVEQGQIIGYVGKTGLATGPHLHYEFRIDGKHKNPLTVKFPPADPITESLYQDFQDNTKPLFKHLELLADKKIKSSEAELAVRPISEEANQRRHKLSDFVN